MHGMFVLVIPAAGTQVPAGSAVLVHAARLTAGVHRAGVAHPRRGEGLADRALRAAGNPDEVRELDAAELTVAAHFHETDGELRLMPAQTAALEQWVGTRLYRQDLHAQSIEGSRRRHRQQMRGAIMRGDLAAADRHRRDGRLSGWW